MTIYKSGPIDKEAQILLNKAHSIIINNDPSKKRPSDCVVIKLVLKYYIGEENGKL